MHTLSHILPNHRLVQHRIQPQNLKNMAHIVEVILVRQDDLRTRLALAHTFSMNALFSLLKEGGASGRIVESQMKSMTSSLASVSKSTSGDM